MRFNKSVSLCIIRWTPTCMLFAKYYATFRAQNTTVYISIPHLLLHYYLIQMQIGEDILTLDVPLSATACILETIYFLGRLNDNPHSHALVLKQNTVELPMWYLNPAGYETFCLSYNCLFIKPPWCTVTMLVPFTSQVTQFGINERNTLRWTFISFMKRLLGVKSGFSTSPRNIKSHIFLPKDFLSYFFKTSETASVSVHLPLQMWGSIRISL